MNQNIKKSRQIAAAATAGKMRKSRSILLASVACVSASALPMTADPSRTLSLPVPTTKHSTIWI